MRFITQDCTLCGKKLTDRVNFNVKAKCFNCKKIISKDWRDRTAKFEKFQKEIRVIERHKRVLNKLCEVCGEPMGITSISRRLCGSRCQAISSKNKRFAVNHAMV